MEIKHLRCSALEIFKTMTNRNPHYMKESFSKTSSLTHSPLNINLNRIILQNIEVIASGV